MKLLVTGAAGRIGGTLVNQARQQGHEVTGYDIKRPAGGSYPKIPFIQGSLDSATIREALGDVDAVYHLAAEMNPANPDDERMFRSNIQGLDSILHAVYRGENRVRHFLFASSLRVYTNDEPLYDPMDEAHPCNPNNYYGMTKLVGEKMIGFFAKDSSTPATYFRFALSVEPSELLDRSGMGSDFFVNSKLQRLEAKPRKTDEDREAIKRLQAVCGKEDRVLISCDSGGIPYRASACDTRDTCQCLLLALENPLAHNTAFNVAYDSAFSYKELGNHIAQKLGMETVSVNLPYRIHYHFSASVAKAKMLLGYKPRYSVFDMIDEAVALSKTA